MSPLLVTVWDARGGYDDDAALARGLARAGGWRTASVFLTPVGSRASGVTSQGEQWVRLPAPVGPAHPQATQLKALSDRLFSLDATRRSLEAGGAGRVDRRRLRVVGQGKALRRLRDRLREDPLEHADLIGELDVLETCAEALDLEVARLDPAVVVAHGPEALVLAAALGRPSVYVPGPARDGARGQAVSVVERRWKPGVSGVVPSGSAPAVWGAALRAAGASDTPDALPPLRLDGPGAGGVRLGIGPANFAGQGWAWGSAVRDRLGASVDVLAVERTSFPFPADISPSPEQWESLDWQLAHLPRALSWTHGLSESLRPLLGLLNGSVISGDLAAFRRAGVSLAVVCHGSEVRSPRAAGSLYEHAPFGPSWDDNVTLQETSDRNVRLLPGIGGPVFVATPDLLDSVPFAVWLPIVVEAADFAPAPSAPLEREVPVVVHAPTNPRFKGTSAIEPVLLTLESEGLLEYRRYGSLPPSEVAAALRDADVLVDHVVIGNYATLSIQALAAGRVVLGHVHDRVRRRIPLEVPILETTPDTVESVLRGVLSDRPAARALAARGPEFARTLHDGRLSAHVLAGWLRASR